MDERLQKRVWKRFTEGPTSTHTSRELLFGENKLYWRLWELQRDFARIQRANRKQKTQLTFTECVLCGGLCVKSFQVIVSWNSQNPSGLAPVINPQRSNNPPQIIEQIAEPRLELRPAGTRDPMTFLCAHALWGGRQEQNTGTHSLRAATTATNNGKARSSGLPLEPHHQLPGTLQRPLCCSGP